MQCYKKNYPRPQFVRSEWDNLNGIWDFRFDEKNLGEEERWFEHFDAETTIRVPFTYETKCSTIEDDTCHENIWYRRSFAVCQKRLQDFRYVLHFEGSDFETKVWVNGQYAGSHRGGYARFSFDVSNFVKDGENDLVVKVEDSADMQQPRGKQRWLAQNFACFYSHTTGIWKTVWGEYVPKTSLSCVKMTPNLEESCLDLGFDVTAPSGYGPNRDLMVETTVSYQGELIGRTSIAVLAGHRKTRVDLFAKKENDFAWGIKKWTPDKPELYDITFCLMKNGQVCDTVGSYFAMREVRLDGPNVLLNGVPLYQRLLLDQGYWKDSHLTPPSEEALLEDIEKIKQMGFNGVRKHQKVEDERFLYWCDVKGLLVWSEAPAAYQFSDMAAAEFTREWMEIVKQNYNHPCIITWTPFNESWGVGQIRTRQDQQHFTEAVYHLTKSFDRYRPVIANDGWEHTVTDILTLHDYEETGDLFRARYQNFRDEILKSEISYNRDAFSFSEGFSYTGQPVIVSEYGGIAFCGGDGFGYGNKVQSEEDFIRRFDEITTAIKEIPYICGYCYTQVSDVQQEENGLMDMERNFKVDPEKIREINLRRVGCVR